MNSPLDPKQGPPNSEAPRAGWLGSWGSLIGKIAVPLLLVTFGTLAFLVVALVIRAVPPAAPTVFPDIVRTSLGVGAGLAATVTLVLAARRQWSNEDATIKSHYQKEQEKLQREEIARAEQADRRTVADDNRYDASQKRTTENFSRSVEQIGHPKAPVRLAGLYALERLGSETDDQRATVLNIVCGYLRMPYEPPGSRPHETDKELFARWEDREQELNVRQVAEGIIRRHRTLGDAQFWPVGEIDLTYAHLSGPEFENCDFTRARFAHATLTGAHMQGAVLQGARLVQADLGAVDLYNSNLIDAVVGETDFRNCDLRRADLANVDFFGCTLQHASLDEANLTGCDLSNANLGSRPDELTSVAGAIWSGATRWPVGLQSDVEQQSDQLSGSSGSSSLFKIRSTFRATTRPARSLWRGDSSEG